MEAKLIKYKKYSQKTCFRCHKELTEGYEFNDIDLCHSCLNLLNRGLSPEYYNAATVKSYLSNIDHQRQFFNAFKKKCNTLDVLNALYNKDLSVSAGYKPMMALKKIDDVWCEKEETPLLMLDLQQLGVIVFRETVRLIAKTEDVMYDFANFGLTMESLFVHTSETDITQGNEMLCISGEQIFKVGDEIKTQVVMVRMLGLKNARHIILTEKYEAKDRKHYVPKKDCLYYYAFVLAFSKRFELKSWNLLDVIGAIYPLLVLNARNHNYNLDLDRDDDVREDDYYSDPSTIDMNKLRADALNFFGLSNYYTLKELKKRRNELLKKYHPDNAGTNMEKYSEYSHKTQMINIFYETLEKEVV